MKILARNHVAQREQAALARQNGRAARMRRRRRFRAVRLGALLLVVALAGAGLADYRIYRERVHAGVEVAGMSLSGQSLEGATTLLSTRAEELGKTEVRFRWRSRTFATTLDELGWRPDPAATAQAAFAVGRSEPFWEDVRDRAVAWVGRISVPWTADWDEEKLDALLAQWGDPIAVAPVEGEVTVDGTTPVGTDPVPGREIDRTEVLALASEVLDHGVSGTFDLPVSRVAPLTTAADVDQAVATINELLAAPLAVNVGPVVSVEVQPQQLAPLVFTVVEMEGDAKLSVQLRPDGAAALFEPYRDEVEIEPRPAEFLTAGSRVRIRPSLPGRAIDPDLAANGLLRIARRPDRTGRMKLAPVEPELTTEEAQELGIVEMISSFTTYHACCEPRVTNIHLGADILDGAIVMPGQTFSLNEHLGERTLEAGFVEAPGIFNGILVPSVGGGISQLTTTVFNAAFFGGYPIPEWQAHSYYISRYPLGREATLSWPSPDLKFVNDTDTALLIKTGYTDVSITVKIFGTKTREVVALDPVVTARTATGYWTQVIRVIKENGVEVGRDEFKTFYKNGSPLTQEEVEAAEEAERQKEKEKAKEEQGGNQGSGDEQPPAEETPPPPDDSGN